MVTSNSWILSRILTSWLTVDVSARWADTSPKLGAADFPMPSPTERHTKKVAAVNTGDYDLAFIGDTITHALDDFGDKYAPLTAMWEVYYAPHNAINLG